MQVTEDKPRSCRDRISNSYKGDFIFTRPDLTTRELNKGN